VNPIDTEFLFSLRYMTSSLSNSPVFIQLGLVFLNSLTGTDLVQESTRTGNIPAVVKMEVVTPPRVALYPSWRTFLQVNTALTFTSVMMILSWPEVVSSVWLVIATMTEECHRDIPILTSP
jgi:hypothetical protein